MSKLVSQVYWVRGDKFSLLLQQIAPEERVGRFANEMQTDLLLKGVIGFRTDANAIDPHDQVLVGTFLKTKPWYTQEIAQLGSDSVQTNEFEAALRHLDWTSNKVSGQKIQCFGLVILVAGMDGRFPNVGGVSGNAAQLAPDSIKNGNDMVVSMGDYLAIQVKTLEDVRVGDLLVRYDSMVGHVAAVVGKKTVNGQTVLLIASANQARDGRVALFEVDDNNFEVTFGVSPFKKIVLRKS